MRIGVFGATGQVGNVMRTLLFERGFPVDEIRYFASARSAGTTLPWGTPRSPSRTPPPPTSPGSTSPCSPTAGSTSKIWAPRVAAAGAVVVDNSSAWRKDPDVPLVVSEVNPEDLDDIPKGIVANPNCTTMAAMPVLKPLHDRAGLVRLHVAPTRPSPAPAASASASSTASCAPVRRRATPGWPSTARRSPCPTRTIYAVPVGFNVVPLAGSIVDDGSLETDEEQKLRNESRKILHIPGPAGVGHLRAGAGLHRPLAWRSTPSSPTTSTPTDALELLAARPASIVADVPNPLQAAGRDEVFVGRVRADQAAPAGKGLELFVVGDNLRKGAALNAVQIAEELLKRR